MTITPRLIYLKSIKGNLKKLMNLNSYVYWKDFKYCNSDKCAYDAAQVLLDCGIVSV